MRSHWPFMEISVLDISLFLKTPNPSALQCLHEQKYTASYVGHDSVFKVIVLEISTTIALKGIYCHTRS